MSGFQNSIGRKNDLVSPIYGINGTFRISDLPCSYDDGIAAFGAAVSTTTKSNALNTGARGIWLSAKFSNGVTSCTINVYRVDPGPVDTLVASFAAVNANNGDGLFVTGLSGDAGKDGVDLQGRQIKIEATTFAGGGSVQITAHRTA